MLVVEGFTANNVNNTSKSDNTQYLHNFVPTVHVLNLLADNSIRSGQVTMITLLEFFGPSRNISEIAKEYTKTIPEYDHKKSDNK